MSGSPRLRSFSPVFPVSDLRAALAHYAALGFTTAAYGDGAGYGFAGRDGVDLHLSAEGVHLDEHAAGVAYLYVDDADALFAEWSRAGVGGRTTPVRDTPYRLREGVHVDPDGNVLRFGSPQPAPVSPGLVGAHLERTYGVGVNRLLPLDEGVLRADLSGGACWVVRIAREGRPPEAASGDAEVLDFLAAQGFPAERCAADPGASSLLGRGVLVTEFVEGVPRARRRDAIKAAGGVRRLGELLGRLTTLPQPATLRDGGAWHHLADGLPGEEILAARRMLEGAEDLVPYGGRGEHDALMAALDEVDTGDGLPRALIHPDFVLANVVATGAPEMVLVDWAGAGVGPRLWSLAFLLFAEGSKHPGRVDLVLDGYRRHAALFEEEIERFTGVAMARPIVFAVWRHCVRRTPLADALAQVDAARVTVKAIDDRLRRLAG